MTTDGQLPGPALPPAGTGPEATGTPDGEWLRVHPASPFVRGWVALAAITFFFGRDLFERTLQGQPVFEDGFARRAPWLLGGGAAVLAVAVLGFVLTWYFTKYQVSGGYVRVNTGLLFRQHRQARLDRVQAIDIVQPLLARIFGLAELKFEVADAGESAVRLAYLRIDDARQLRATILARASGAEASFGAVPAAGINAAARSGPGSPSAASFDPSAPEAPEIQVLSVPPSRLVGSLLLSEQSFFIVVGGFASVVLSALTDNRAFYFYLVPAALGLAASYWNFFNKGYNFTAAVSPDGIRLRYGLLDTQAQTLPPGRIQAVKIAQPPLWRPFGWYRMQVNVAGYGASGNAVEGNTRTILLPVGKFADVLAMLSLVLPDPGTERPAEVFAAGLMGSGSDGGFTTTPRRARLLAPLAWRRNGFAATDTALLIRSGRWWRDLVLVPHQRTQSLAIHQGPVARRFRVADLVLHTTAGPVAPRLTQAGLDEARQLFDEQSARARLARKRQTTEQWLRQVVPAVEPAAVPDTPVPGAPHPGTPASEARTHYQQEGQTHG
ncbi:PH domain-containing protein [Pseudarthrobacter sp. LT1]|uniref:PH domain-containing protein n=1 Tax=Pseudarthrobacter sp. LT1 TaxID=3111450 RepID=UPI002D77C466|nr:PH domain-containing protein [Pseudarthrobacter sp. LT1]WRT14161.1 PH domain-containing protein [Pseudarthrobacter sp. LT1]